MMKALMWAMVIVCLFACTDVQYKRQAIAGQWQMTFDKEPIEQVLQTDGLSEAERKKLMLAEDARTFAGEQLLLNHNGSYTQYVDLQRQYAVWNIFAAPELSLEPKQWCYWLLGCFTYRGYFDKSMAEEEAVRLQAQNYDVYQGPVMAYSTLNWFNDPVTNVMLQYNDLGLVELVFHELAHQKLYVKGDTTFNESYATVVATEGVRRWLSAHQQSERFDAWRTSEQQHQQFVQLILTSRDELEKVYQQPIDDQAKRQRKQQVFRQLQSQLSQLQSQWGNDAYVQWVEAGLNNAKLNSIGAYYDWVPALEQLMEQCQRQLDCFYQQTADLAKQPVQQRNLALQSLMAQVL